MEASIDELGPWLQEIGEAHCQIPYSYGAVRPYHLAFSILCNCEEQLEVRFTEKKLCDVEITM